MKIKDKETDVTNKLRLVKDHVTKQERNVKVAGSNQKHAETMLMQQIVSFEATKTKYQDLVEQVKQEESD